MSNFLDESANFQPGKSEEPVKSTINGTVNSVGTPADTHTANRQTLRECVTTSLEDYFNKVDHEHISNLYELVLSEVEAPLLACVMQQTRSNQSKASAMLGLNRGTLRKKLKKYGMLN